jgi:hypothetical protein
VTLTGSLPPDEIATARAVGVPVEAGEELVQLRERGELVVHAAKSAAWARAQRSNVPGGRPRIDSTVGSTCDSSSSPST